MKKEGETVTVALWTISHYSPDYKLYDHEEEYGLTDLEMCDVLADIGHSFLRGAVCDQQERRKARSGATGTPQEDR